MAKKNSPTPWIQTATRYRYALPVMAELARDKGCKFVTLMRRLEASDRAIRQALDYLIGIGWVMRNPGYGHPLGPEYVLSEKGEICGARSLIIWEALGQWSERELALERWPLTVALLIAREETRFGQIRAQMPEVSPRALALALKRVEGAGIAIRAVQNGHPPVVSYQATKWGRELALLLGPE